MTARNEIAIRLATPADAADLAGLANALDRDQGGAGKVHSAATVLRDGFGADAAVTFVIATSGGQAMGYAMFCRFYNSDTAETGSYHNDLHVVPHAQRLGVGRRLFAAVAAETARRGGAFVWTGVYTANAAARAFYASLGARDEDARILEVDGERFRALVMADACGTSGCRQGSDERLG
jgi:GNAT superfamily N-acetyltransferase